jgi:DNA-binding transcriptional LysR family regulator
VAPELRQLRAFVAVAERSSFTAAAGELHVAQQAVSQQIRALEKTLGVTLFRRTSRRVELTPEGAVFLVDARRVLANADRAVSRVQAAARGEAGTVRLAYTLTTVYDTVPTVLATLNETLPQLKIDAREVFGGDLVDLFETEHCDIALAPKSTYPRGIRQRAIRSEVFRVAVGERHRLADRTEIQLSELHDERFEFWPREMAPGYYDAVEEACHAAGFEPDRDEQAAGSTVWGNIARPRHRPRGQHAHRAAPARPTTRRSRPTAAATHIHGRLGAPQRPPRHRPSHRHHHSSRQRPRMDLTAWRPRRPDPTDPDHGRCP